MGAQTKINWNDAKYSLADVLAEANKGNLDAMYPAVVRLIKAKYDDDDETLALIVPLFLFGGIFYAYSSIS